MDDDPSALRSLARLLGVYGFHVRTFASPESLLADIESFEPACLIADLAMPGITGLELQRILRESGRDYPIVFITGHGDIRASVLAMRGGAIDFLTKPFEQRDLLEAIGRGLTRTRQRRERIERVAEARRRLASLTERELEVFDQVATGLMNKQIAANLGISEKTVKVHRARVMRKMAVRSVAQLARLAERIGAEQISDRFRAAGQRP